MGHTWVLSAPDGLHVGPMNLAIRDGVVSCDDSGDDDEDDDAPQIDRGPMDDQIVVAV